MTTWTGTTELGHLIRRTGTGRPLHLASCPCWSNGGQVPATLPSVHDYDPLAPDGVPLPPVRENVPAVDVVDVRWRPRWRR